MTIKSPCFNCMDRHSLCHSTCSKYAQFKKDIAELTKKRVTETTTNYIYQSYMRDRCMGSIKRRIK